MELKQLRDSHYDTRERHDFDGLLNRLDRLGKSRPQIAKSVDKEQTWYTRTKKQRWTSRPETRRRFKEAWEDEYRSLTHSLLLFYSNWRVLENIRARDVERSISWPFDGEIFRWAIRLSISEMEQLLLRGENEKARELFKKIKEEVRRSTKEATRYPGLPLVLQTFENRISGLDGVIELMNALHPSVAVLANTLLKTGNNVNDHSTNEN